MVLYQGVLALSPAKAEPLLLAPEVKAYSTSEKPCAPLSCTELVAVFRIESGGPASAIDSAVKPRTRVGVMRM